ncbi:glycosyl transferase [Bacillus coahuilensis p1.1.43]|uniref:Glycosyl transferase n=1 Tax=Bacillus coahuilensis p1.1.43 TaxID=1150625 RepID=A0A147K900_9BACI|nr:glycosyltransferase family 1 protein [Bacillus coahuilensis]KUP06607.1 glycosyl transferase [Bacillus coahuilensis p1.1.43]
MRVAIFTDTYYPQVNGVARTLKRLTEQMSKRGYEYEVFAPEIDNSPLYPNVHQFTSIPFLFYPECRTAFANPKTIEKRLKEFKPDLIHITTPLTLGLYGLHAAKKLKIPVVGSYHTHFDLYLDYYKMSWISPLLWKYMKWFHAPFEKIFVPSQETKLHLETQGFTDLSIWSRGVNCEIFTPDKREEGRLHLKDKYSISSENIALYVGRLAPEKDLNTLIYSIKNTSVKTKEDLHWIIVGDGPCMEELKGELEEEKVLFTGYLSGNEIAMMYAAADVFLFPSATETFGNVVLESLSSGVPSIVSNQGGVKDIVTHEINGLKCEAGNGEQFVNALEYIINNPSVKHEMAKRARLYALEQSWDCIFDRLFSEYEEIIFYHHQILKHA